MITIKNNKIINYGNRGMALEEDINLTNNYYIEKKIALIYKKPIPIKVLKINETKTRIKDAFNEGKTLAEIEGEIGRLRRNDPNKFNALVSIFRAAFLYDSEMMGFRLSSIDMKNGVKIKIKEDTTMAKKPEFKKILANQIISGVGNSGMLDPSFTIRFDQESNTFTVSSKDKGELASLVYTFANKERFLKEKSSSNKSQTEILGNETTSPQIDRAPVVYTRNYFNDGEPKTDTKDGTKPVVSSNTLASQVSKYFGGSSLSFKKPKLRD